MEVLPLWMKTPAPRPHPMAVAAKLGAFEPSRWLSAQGSFELLSLLFWTTHAFLSLQNSELSSASTTPG